MRKYPWAEWANGDIWLIKRGEDFDVPFTNMVKYVYAVAARQGCKVKVQQNIASQTIAFQFKE